MGKGVCLFYLIRGSYLLDTLPLRYGGQCYERYE